MEYIVSKKKKDDYLIHYGVPGMKWGVRRYQNKDGSLTPAGKKKALMDQYEKVGASKQLQRSHGYKQLRDSEVLNKTEKAINRLQNSDNAKYTAKQRAKDYDTAIRGLNQLKGQAAVDTYYDIDKMRSNASRIEKLQNKKPSDKTMRKLNKLITDNDLMSLRALEASEKYKKYNDTATALINQMANDKAVVYTTRYRVQASSGVDYGYEISGTDYKVRANTKRRAKSKKYNDTMHKKQYDTELNKYTTVYF